MHISYNKLWKLLIDKNMNKQALREASGISSASIAKLGKGDNITTEVLLRICEALDCDISDIMEVVKDAPVISQIKALCEECDVEFELISKLIIEIEANKNYTRSAMVTKAFDKIINQGWLHFDSIEKGLQYEN